MSNRFPADDEHLHPYPGNLKHHKVEKDFFRVEEEERRKLLCEMMKDDAKSGLYNEKKRPPLLSDDALVELTVKEDGRRPSEQVRDFYEAARAKDAELIQQAVDEFRHLLTMRQDEIRAIKPAPPWEIMEAMLTQSASAKFYIDFLEKAAAAGFKPTEP